MSLRADRRAQSMVYLKALGTLILFAGFYAVFQEPVSMLFQASADTTTTSQAATGRSYVKSGWQWLPLAAVGLVVLWVIAASIFRSGGVR